MGLFTRGRGGRTGTTADDADVRAHASDVMSWRDPSGVFHDMPKDTFINEVLPTMLDSHWHDPDTIAFLCRDGMTAGLHNELDEASERLLDIDRNPERAVLIRSEVLRHLDRPDDAEGTLSTFIRNYGETANALTERARVYMQLGDDADAYETLWRSIELDANRPAALEWWIELSLASQIFNMRTDALQRAAELPTAWLPVIDLARDALRARDVPVLLARYREVMERGAHDSFVLANVISDLGTAGFQHELVDVVNPWYLPARHGTEIGLVLLETCISTGQTGEGDSLVVKLGGLGSSETRERVRELAGELDDVKRGVTAPKVERGVPPKVTDTMTESGPEPPSLAPLRRHLRPVAANATTGAPHSDAPDEDLPPSSPSTFSVTPLWFDALHRPDWLFEDAPRSSRKVVVLPFSDLNKSADHGRRSLGLAYLLADRLMFTTDCDARVVTQLDGNHLPELAEDLADPIALPGLLGEHADAAFVIDGRLAGHDDTLEVLSRVTPVASPEQAWTASSRAIVAGSDAIFDATDAVLGHLGELGVAKPHVMDGSYAPPPPRLVDEYIDAYADVFELMMAVARGHTPETTPSLRRLARLTRAHSGSIVPKCLFFAALDAASRVRSPGLHELEEDVVTLIKGESNPASTLYALSPFVFRLFHMDQLFNDRSDELTLAGDPRMWAWLGRM